MLAQKTGGSVVTITAALARNPIRGVTAAVPMITKGGRETITQHLAMEYALCFWRMIRHAVLRSRAIAA